MAVGLLAAPIIARLYDPDSLGTFSVLSTLVMVLAACNSLCYDTAMPLAESVSKRRALFVLVAGISVVSTALLTVAVLVGSQWAATCYGRPELASYAVFVPPLFMATGVMRLIGMSLNCEKQFSRVAIREVVRRTGTSVVQIAAGLASLAKNPLGLLLGALCGTVVAALAFSTRPVRSLFCRPEEPFRVADVKAVAIEYKRFPLIQFWSQTFNSLTAGFPVFVMGFLFDVKVVGLYTFARQLLVLPVVMFASSGSQVFYVDAAQSAKHGASMASATSELLRLLLLLTAFPFAVVFLFGPVLFDVVLGPQWREAGVYGQILAPWIATMAISSPLSTILLAKNRLGESFAYNFGLFVVRLTGLVAGGWLVGPKTALALFAGGSAVIYIHLLGRTLRLAEVGRRWAALVAVRSYAEAMLMLAPAGLLYWWAGMKYLSLAALALACAAHLAVLDRRHPRIHAIIMGMLSRAGGLLGR